MVSFFFLLPLSYCKMHAFFVVPSSGLSLSKKSQKTVEWSKESLLGVFSGTLFHSWMAL